MSPVPKRLTLVYSLQLEVEQGAMPVSRQLRQLRLRRHLPCAQSPPTLLRISQPIMGGEE